MPEPVRGQPALPQGVVPSTGNGVLLPEQKPIPLPPPLPKRRGIVGRSVRFLWRSLLTVLGVATLILALAIVATIPILQFLSLGYLLEVSGRVARGGGIRSGFIGLRSAGIAGMVLAFLGAAWLALRFFSAMAINAEIIAPGSGIAGAWTLGVFIGLGVLVVLSALMFGFVRLIRRGVYAELRDEVWRIVTDRVPFYFWLGLRGFAGGLLWLAVPITLLAAAALIPNADQSGLGGVLRLVGSILLMTVVLCLPFLQTRMAARDRFTEMFAWRSVREQFRRAPLAFWLAATVTLLFALPLYLLKIELVPADAAWLPSLAFVIFIFPARVLAGWAYARSQRRDTRRHWAFRWLARLGMVPVAAFYVLIVFFSQFTGWHGVFGMYEQHAFLLPVPFLGM